MSEERKSKEKGWIHTIMLNAYFEDALAKFRARTGYGVTFALYNSLNEFWHETGDMTDEGYEKNKKQYAETLIEAKRRKEARRIPASPLTERKFYRKRGEDPLSKLSLEQLEQRYDQAQKKEDYAAIQLLQFEARKRGFKFRYENGQVKKWKL